jgi:hypothetical protein
MVNDKLNETHIDTCFFNDGISKFVLLYSEEPQMIQLAKSIVHKNGSPFKRRFIPRQLQEKQKDYYYFNKTSEIIGVSSIPLVRDSAGERKLIEKSESILSAIVLGSADSFVCLLCKISSFNVLSFADLSLSQDHFIVFSFGSSQSKSNVVHVTKISLAAHESVARKSP